MNKNLLFLLCFVFSVAGFAKDAKRKVSSPSVETLIVNFEKRQAEKLSAKRAFFDSIDAIIHGLGERSIQYGASPNPELLAEIVTLFSTVYSVDEQMDCVFAVLPIMDASEKEFFELLNEKSPSIVEEVKARIKAAKRSVKKGNG